LLAISIGVSAVLHPEFGEEMLSLLSPSKSKNLTIVQAEDLSTKSENSEKSESATASAMPSLALKGLQWLTELPDEQYVIEFQTFETVEDAQKEIKTQSDRLKEDLGLMDIIVKDDRSLIVSESGVETLIIVIHSYVVR
jgi:translation elongation factor P/translation initiation factor 5A